jgi:hypothetical protein
MDLKLFMGVMRRHKRVTIGGFLLALVLAVFAYGQPTFANGKPTLVPRGTEVWQTQAQLLITQQNDPYGDVVNGLPLTDGKPTSKTSQNPPLQVGSVDYLASLAPVYAAIANGDAVQSQVHKIGPTASVVAIAMTDPTTGLLLPVVQLTVTSFSQGIAYKAANLAATTLERYVVSEQAAAGVPAVQRVRLSNVQNGLQVKLIKGHKPTVPMLVFVAVLAAAITLAFVLENYRNGGNRAAEGASDGPASTHETAPSPAGADAARALAAASARPDRAPFAASSG